MSSPPAFRHLGDRLVHQGYIWHVVVATFESPDGELFERDVIRSPGAVGVLPLLFEDGVPTVVFVRQYRGPLDQYVLEIPAGMRDVPEESLELTAERELIEEAGFSAGRLEYLTHFLSSAGMTDSVLHLYLATDLSPVARDVHGPEETHMEVLRLPLAEAVEMVARGEINDAKTVIGLLLVDRRIRDGSLVPPS
ncbi:MAG: NUDIX hydrolase [Ilumatobacteraceae bacterium]|nr:NUDIX hydrolase [Ilumatobacteraceae bacterium]